jgi:Cys-tRNA(Pro)/Cys-tRNA(Cys) deacylase
MEEKTNVMRLLDQKKLPYTPHFYGNTEAISATEVAQVLGQEPERVFKTLVTVGGRSKRNFVFVIPAAEELDLKKAAAAVGEKSIEMIHVSEINKLTGYIRGGCSPIGMKKLYTTTIDESAEPLERIFVSAGKIGMQLGINPKDLANLVNAKFADITTE